MATDISIDQLAPSHFKDSCSYSVETAKQLLTFAAGGLAFVTGVSMSAGAAISRLHFLAFFLFTGSILFGVLYIMSVVGNINKSNNYDVYSGWLRCCSGIQMLTFVGGAIVLALIVFFLIHSQHNVANPSTNLEVSSGGRTIRYTVPPASEVSARISASGDVEIRVEKGARAGQ